jgi:hypothetical protein
MMSNGIERVLARRIWFVPDIMVWGTTGLGELDYVTAEKVNGVTSVLYGYSSFVDGRQHLSFGELTDHRGNKLPEQIPSARVLIRPKDANSVFVIGQETSTGVTLARDDQAIGPVITDLLVVEMGD